MEANKIKPLNIERAWQIQLHLNIWTRYSELLVFSVTPFKIDQNKNQNHSVDKVQNLGNETRYIYKDPRQDSGQRNITYTRYPKECFTQTYRDCLESPWWYSPAWAPTWRTETNRNICYRVCYKGVNLYISFEKLINIKVILFLIHELFR